MKIETDFKIGDSLRDIVTGFEGICLAVTKYSTGCIHYGLQSECVTDGKPADLEWFWGTRLKLAHKNKVEFSTGESVGGPQPNAPQG